MQFVTSLLNTGLSIWLGRREPIPAVETAPRLLLELCRGLAAEDHRVATGKIILTLDLYRARYIPREISPMHTQGCQQCAQCFSSKYIPDHTS